MFAIQQQFVKQLTVDLFASAHQTTLGIPTQQDVVCKLREIAHVEIWIVQSIQFVKRVNVSTLVKDPVVQMPFAKSSNVVQFVLVQRNSHRLQEVR
jgi:hypothetical protein